MGREQILNILGGNLALGHIRPRDIVALGRKVRVLAVPAVGVRRKEATHEPCARRVVNMIHIAVRAENISRVKLAVLVEIQMIFCDELFEVCRAEVALLRAEGVF